MCAGVKDQNLAHVLQFGIGMHHAGLNERDRQIVEELFCSCKIQVLVATSTLAWGVNTPTHLVIIKGTEYFDAPTRRCAPLGFFSFWSHLPICARFALPPAAEFELAHAPVRAPGLFFVFGPISQSVHASQRRRQQRLNWPMHQCAPLGFFFVFGSIS